MLNILWPIFIIISIVYAILSGNLQNLNNSIFEATDTAVSLTLTLIGTTCLWSGIMEVASKTNIIEYLVKVLSPVIKRIFNNKNLESKAYNNIIMNTASLQIIPSTVIAIRSSLESDNPAKIIFPVWISTICAAIVAVVFCKILIKYTSKK